MPNRRDHPAVWRAVANPGVVVVDGGVVATWRGRQRSGRYEVTITPLGRGVPLPSADDLDEDLRAIGGAMGFERADPVVP